MYVVQWMHDSRASEYEICYFTRGTPEQQESAARAFASALGIKPERGYVTVREIQPEHPALAHPELEGPK